MYRLAICLLFVGEIYCLLDTSYNYRLTNKNLGSQQSLSVQSNRLKMTPTSSDTKQYWKFVALGGEKYALRSQYFGDCFSLDISQNTPMLAPTGSSSGQFWILKSWGDGTYKLINGVTGPDKSLDTSGSTNDLVMNTGDYKGQHWTLTQLSKITINPSIPTLDSKGYVYKTMGPTDNMYVKPIGTVKGVMIFVDFSNAAATGTDAADTAKHLLGDGSAQKLFHDQSYKKLTLDVTVKSNLGWKRMPSPSTTYSYKDFDSHKKYISAAVSLFKATEVKFSDYDIVFVVAPKEASFPLSPAFNAAKGNGASSPSGEVRLAVTFGKDSYTNSYINLVHEVGHLFGLPDLYADADQKVGCWSIMSDIFHSLNFFGFERHKNGWLDSSRKIYIPSSTKLTQTLSPLSSECGISMMVFPIDNARKPSKVFVVELAQAVLGTNGKKWGEGILLYTVDATKPTSFSPVVVIPKTTSRSNEYGYLYEAPFGVGDTISQKDGKATITLTVVQRMLSSYVLTIDFVFSG